jgi:hypothetical protein
MKLGTGSWRDVIVARRTRKSSASFDAPAMVSLRELAGAPKVRGEIDYVASNHLIDPRGIRSAG